ncbi:MAG: hypothetical protein KIS81_08270 [Maricaulaceae bacterium]|nr:hypothetical protein [Maricaulaceae bacterium]
MPKRLGVWAIIVAALLLIPLIAMRFTSEVNWTASDFLFAGALLYGAAAVYELAASKATRMTHRLAIGATVLLVLAFIWVWAATGFERFLG